MPPEPPFTPSLLWGPCGPFVGPIVRCYPFPLYAVSRVYAGGSALPTTLSALTTAAESSATKGVAQVVKADKCKLPSAFPQRTGRPHRAP